MIYVYVFYLVQLYQLRVSYYTVKSVLRGHLWDKEKVAL